MSIAKYNIFCRKKERKGKKGNGKRTKEKEREEKR